MKITFYCSVINDTQTVEVYASNLWIAGSNLAPVWLFTSFVKFYTCMGAYVIDFQIFKPFHTTIIYSYTYINGIWCWGRYEDNSYIFRRSILSDLPLEKDVHGPSNLYPFHAKMPCGNKVWLKLAQGLWRRLLKVSMHLHCVIIFSHWSNLNPLHQRHFCAKFSCNWPSGSEGEGV